MMAAEDLDAETAPGFDPPRPDARFEGLDAPVPAAAEPPRHRGRVVHNVAVLMGSQMVTWVLALVLTIATPRYLGPDGIGQLRLGAAVWGIAVVFAEFGTSVVLTLEFARDRGRARSLLGPVVLLRSALGVLATFAVLAFVVIAGYDLDTALVVMITGVGVLVLMISEIPRAAMYGMQEMGPSARADIASKALMVVVVLAALVAGGQAMAVALVTALPGVLLLWMLWRALLSRADVQSGPRKPFALASVARQGSPFLLGTAVTVVYTSLDVVVISLLASEDEIGWYATAGVLLGSLLFIPSTIMTSWFPAVAQVHGSNPEAVPVLLGRAIRSSWLIAVPLGLGTMVVAPTVCTLVAGEDFRPAGSVLAVYGIVLIFMFQTILLGRFAFAIGRHHLFNTVMIVATILTVPLDLVLVPWTHREFGNGAIGGAMSYVCTELLIFVVLVWRLAPSLVSKSMALRIGKCALAGGAMVAATWPLRDRFLPIPVVVGAVVFGVAVALLRLLDDDERDMLRKVTRRLPFGGPTRGATKPPISNEVSP